VYCEDAHKALEVCKDCKFYNIGVDDGIEEHLCENDERWKAEGYTDEDFEEDTCGLIYMMASFVYSANGDIVDCDFFGTCGGKFKERG